MAITKICGMLSTKNIESITFASVNRASYCTELHYIKHEIERFMNLNELPELKNIIVENNKIYSISDDSISLSKDLVKLSKLI